MRILFLSHYFPPEVNAPANRTFEHCCEWVQAGHDVHVVTCIPSHPRGVPFAGYARAWHVEEEYEGIHVHRVWTYLAANQGVVRRTLNYVSFVPSAVFRALRLGPFDVVVATSPQFFCAMAGGLSGALSRTPWVFELRDLWPESVAAVGALHGSVVLRILEWVELALYRHASRVVCLTHAFIDNLASRGIPRNKLVFIPNGIRLDAIVPGDTTAARKRNGLPADATIVSYVGTIGLAHGIGTILDVAKRLRHDAPGVRFVIVGDGADLDAVRERARGDDLRNITFTGLLAREEAIGFLQASDISLVLLRRSQLFRTVLPSKLFESMAAARPVVLGVEGEAREVLERAQAGIAVEPENSQAIAGAVVRLARDPQLRRRMGEAGRAFVERDFNRRVWALRYAELLQSLAARC